MPLAPGTIRSAAAEVTGSLGGGGPCPAGRRWGSYGWILQDGRMKTPKG